VGLHAVAGSKIYIGRRVAARQVVRASDFDGAPWLEINGWAQSGQLGDVQEVISQNLISQRRVRKGKGTRNAGRMENVFTPMPLDPGQQRLQAAVASCAAYEFKIEWAAGCGDAGDEEAVTDLFYGMAFPGVRSGGEANTAQLRSWAFEIISNIVEELGSAPANILTYQGSPLTWQGAPLTWSAAV
jgi:hypothetical protein